MVTKDRLKKEIDKLPDDHLDEAYALLKKMTKSKKTTKDHLELRDFGGRFDNINVRGKAYE